MNATCHAARTRRRRQRVWNHPINSGSPTHALRCVSDGGALLASLDPQSSVRQAYLWGLDMSGTMQGAGGVGGLLAVTDASQNSHFCAYDGNGNVTALVKADGSGLTAQYEYGPFGELLRATGPMAKANPFRFSTKYQDDESDLIYYGYRYYDPSTGRWPNSDPIGEDGGVNLYVMARNNAVGHVDILGLMGPGTTVPYYRVDPTSVGRAARDPDPFRRPFSGMSVFSASESGAQNSLDAWYQQGVLGLFSSICNSGAFGPDTVPTSHVRAWVRNTGRCCVRVRLICEASFNAVAYTPLSGKRATWPVVGHLLERQIQTSETVVQDLEDAIDNPINVPTPALTYINSQATWSSQRTVEWDLPPGKKREAYYLSASVSLTKPANGLVAFTEQMRASCHLEVLGGCTGK